MRRLIGLMALLLATGACAGSGPAAPVLPVVDVLDVATGESVDVSSLLPAERPLLVWFWAPH